MAVGKGRNKRSSGNSYASTATTVVFVALCVIGVWMLTPNSILYPQTTTTTSRNSISQSHSNSDKLIPTRKQKNNPAAFQDNPGDLPDEAIKSDIDQEDPKPLNDNDDDQKYASENSNHETESENRNDEKLDLERDKAAAESNDENVGTADIQEPQSGTEGEENVKQEADPAVEENPEGLQGKVTGEEEQKLNEHEAQLSEESAITHNQQTEEIDTTDDKSKSIERTFETMEGNIDQAKDDQLRNPKQDEAATRSESEVQEESQRDSQSNDQLAKRDEVIRTESRMQEENQTELQSEGQENSKDTHNEVSDEENEQRMEQQQQQEEDQVKQSQHHKEEEEQSQSNETDREGETNNDQIQNDESPGDSTDSSDQHNHETVQEEEIQEPQNSQSLQTNENENEIKPNQEKKRRKKHGKSSNSEDSSFPSGENSGIPRESKESKNAWSTQADQSENQKERRKSSSPEDQDSNTYGYSWQLCNVTAGTDYVPCLDNEKSISKLRSRRHYEHRERHCPDEAPTCLVPLPQGYKRPVEWPRSRDKIWYHNVPHTLLAEVKGHQNWVKLTGEFLTFPGGGTQFIHGALHYIDFIQQAVPDIAWGKRTRTVLDVGCGVASFGGFLFERDVLAMSFAPKDEHEAQVQFALERGIPAISAVMGSQRLPFPSRVFDLIHCARCRVPWHVEGGALLLELNRMLRPGGYFVWSATPVYQKLQEDVQIWKEMSALTVSMCWELVTIKKDKLNSVGAAIYHKPESNECYEERKHKQPPMCKSDDDPNAAWYVPLQSCMHRVPVHESERGSQWPQEWPRRLQTAPYWLNRSQIGIYGKPAPDDFAADYDHWQRVVSKSYPNGLGISWSNVRNIMDMRAVYGGFAAALKDLNVWVLNVVNIDSPDTLPIIYERGLFGIYHDWCESFSTYPRTYDLLHADHLFSRLKKRCKIAPVMAEIDRIVRPGGKLIVRDESNAIGEAENLLKSLHWEVNLIFSKNQEGILSAQKSDWRPDSYAAPS